ncbi:MAG: polysaccharide biosynthesis/export family protein [Erythrobacter sp.]
MQVVSSDALPAPTGVDLVANTRAYLIGPFDKLSIEVFGIEDLRRNVQIDAAGRVDFPLVGAIEASGLTPQQLADEIESRLRGRYVKDPQVTVNLEDAVSQIVTIDGEVVKPGLYPVQGRMTLMRTVAVAGGIDEYANLQDVVVFREVDGQRMAGIYNLEAIRRGNYADPEIYGNDIVIVGDSPSRRRLDQLLDVVPSLVTPLVVLLRN